MANKISDRATLLASVADREVGDMITDAAEMAAEVTTAVEAPVCVSPEYRAAHGAFWTAIDRFIALTGDDPWGVQESSWQEEDGPYRDAPEGPGFYNPEPMAGFASWLEQVCDLPELWPLATAAAQWLGFLWETWPHVGELLVEYQRVKGSPDGVVTEESLALALWHLPEGSVEKKRRFAYWVNEGMSAHPPGRRSDNSRVSWEEARNWAAWGTHPDHHLWEGLDQHGRWLKLFAKKDGGRCIIIAKSNLGETEVADFWPEWGWTPPDFEVVAENAMEEWKIAKAVFLSLMKEGGWKSDWAHWAQDFQTERELRMAIRHAQKMKDLGQRPESLYI